MGIPKTEERMTERLTDRLINLLSDQLTEKTRLFKKDNSTEAANEEFKSNFGIRASSLCDDAFLRNVLTKQFDKNYQDDTESLQAVKGMRMSLGKVIKSDD